MVPSANGFPKGMRPASGPADGAYGVVRELAPKSWIRLNKPADQSHGEAEGHRKHQIGKYPAPHTGTSELPRLGPRADCRGLLDSCHVDLQVKIF